MLVVNSLKVGDKVLVQSSTVSAWKKIETIVKITPTGRIKTDTGLTYGPDGLVRGDEFSIWRILGKAND